MVTHPGFTETLTVVGEYVDEGLRPGLEAATKEVGRFGRVLRSIAFQTYDVDRKTGEMTKTYRSFKMEYLSIMFFGMQIYRIFGGMVKRVLELTGVFEMWRGTLIMILFPVLIPLSKILFKLLGWIMQLSPETRAFIGVLILAAAALGFLLMTIGQVGLGIGGLIKFFKWFALVAKVSLWVVIGWIVALGLIIWGIIEVVLSWGKNWEKVFKGFAKVALGIGILIALIFGGWIPVAIGAAVAAVLWLIGHFDVLRNAVVGAISFVWDKLKAFWNWLKGTWLGKIIGAVGGIFTGGASLAGFQYGGVVPGVGPQPIMAHGGERISPAGAGGGFAPTINIYASITSDMDIGVLGTKLARYQYEEFERLSRTRGI